MERSELSELSERHVVIIGGGFGGLTAAKVLRRQAMRVTVLDRHNYHLFQPLLYQVATATLSPGDIASPIRWIFRKSPNVRVLLGEADSVDVAGRRARLTDGGAVAYDYLIVATGSSHGYFGHSEWARDAPGLKTLEDALEIRRRILLAFERAERESGRERRQELLTFVLIGGGPTGVELAGTLAEIARQTLRHEFRSIDPGQARIVLVEAGPTILPSFPPKLRDAQVAIQQATHAARTIVDREHGAASVPFVFHDKGSMAIVGRRSALADLGWIAFSGTLAWLAWLFLHIFMLIGFRNRLVVLLQWAVAYFTYQRSVRLITYQQPRGS